MISIVSERAPDVALQLPPPPSMNRLWRFSHDGVHASQEYVRWLKQCGPLVALQAGGYRVPYRFHLRITLGEQRKDLDNNAKPIGDLLQRCRVITNDKHMRRLVLDIDPERTTGDVLVEVWALLGEAPALKPPRPKPGRMTAEQYRELIGQKG